MALTIPQLAVALRIIGAETDTVPAGVTAVLTRQAAVARALATAHAPSAPEDVADEAVVRLTGFLYDQSPSLPRANNPMVASGAGSLLAPWHVARLLFPAGGPGAAGGGVNTAAVEAIVAAAVEAIRQLPAGGADGQFLGRAAGAPAWVPAPAGAGGGLSAGQRAALEGAVQLDSVALSGNDLTLANDGGTAKSIPLALVPTIENADANKVLKVDDGGTTADWRDESSGGLDQAAVDARVTALRPRAVPSYAAGDAAEVLTVDPGGAGHSWRPIPEPAELDTRAALPGTGGFEVGDIINVGGNLWKLAAAGTDSATHHGTIASRTGDLIGDDSFEFDKSAISAYLPYDVVGSAPPVTVYAEFDAGGYHVETLLTRASGQVAGELPNQVGAGDNWEYQQTTAQPLLDTDAVSVGQPFTVSYWQDKTKTTPLSVVPQAARWVHAAAEGVHVASWAQAGDSSRVPKPKLPGDVVYQIGRLPKTRLPSDTAYTADLPVVTVGENRLHTYPGLRVNPAGTGVRPITADLFNPTVDLDTDPHGEFHWECSVTMGPIDSHTALDVNAGFRMGGTNQTDADRTRILSGIVFASAVSAADTFSYQGVHLTQDKGVTIINLPVYSSNTLIGRFMMMMIRDGQNRVGLYRWWEGVAGVQQITITADFRATWTPSDSVARNQSARLLPTGGADGQFLGRTGGRAAWLTSSRALPTGGADGQFLGRTGGAPAWVAPPRTRIFRLTSNRTLIRRSGIHTFTVPVANCPNNNIGPALYFVRISRGSRLINPANVGATDIAAAGTSISGFTNVQASRWNIWFTNAGAGGTVLTVNTRYNGAASSTRDYLTLWAM